MITGLVLFQLFSLEVFLNGFAKGLAKPLPKTLRDGIINKDVNK